MSNFLKTAQIDWNKLKDKNTNNSYRCLLNLDDGNIKANIENLEKVEDDSNAKALAVLLGMIKASLDAQFSDESFLAYRDVMKTCCKNIFESISVDETAHRVYFSQGISKEFSKLCGEWEEDIKKHLKNSDKFELVKKLSEENAKMTYGVRLKDCNTEGDYEKLTKEIFNTFRARELRSGLHDMKKGIGRLFSRKNRADSAATKASSAAAFSKRTHALTNGTEQSYLAPNNPLAPQRPVSAPLASSVPPSATQSPAEPAIPSNNESTVSRKNSEGSRDSALKRGFSKFKNAVLTGRVRYHGAGDLKKQTDSDVNNEEYRTIKEGATLTNSQVRLLKDFNEKYIRKWLDAGKVFQEKITDIFTNKKTEKFNSLQDSLQKIFEYLNDVKNKTLLKEFVNKFYNDIKEFRNAAASIDAENFGNATDRYTITHASEAFETYFKNTLGFVKLSIAAVGSVRQSMSGFKGLLKMVKGAKGSNRFIAKAKKYLKFFKEISDGIDFKKLGIAEEYDYIHGLYAYVCDPSEISFDLNFLNIYIANIIKKLEEVDKELLASGVDKKFKKLALSESSPMYRSMRAFMNEISGFYETKPVDRKSEPPIKQ